MVSLEIATKAIDAAKYEAMRQLEDTTNNALGEMERVGVDALNKLNEFKRNNPQCKECPIEAQEIQSDAISILDSILKITIASLNMICGYTCKEARHIFDLGLKYMGPASDAIEKCFDDLARVLQNYIKELTRSLDKFEKAVKKDLQQSAVYAKQKKGDIKKFMDKPSECHGKEAVEKKSSSSHILRKLSRIFGKSEKTPSKKSLDDESSKEIYVTCPEDIQQNPKCLEK